MKLEQIIKMIEEAFANGEVKQIASKEMIRKLKEKGFERIDIDDALDEAERRKVIAHDVGFYKWINPDLRETEIAKTKKSFEALAEIFKEGKITFLTREDIIATLQEKGFNEEDVRRTIIDAERDHVLRFTSRSFEPGRLVRGCSWIPPEELQRKAETERHERKLFEKWLEEKIAQDDY